MQTSGLFTTAVREIKINSVASPILLIPFGDVHQGAPGYSERHWREFLADAKNKKNAYYLGMGDYIDFASASERAALKQINLHDATRELLETVAYKQLADFRKSIAWMGDRLLGIIGGNHTFEFSDGELSDKKLADMLGCPWLGVCTVLRLQINYHGRYKNLDIFAHHGRGGGGTTEGNSINQVAKLRAWMEADIYIEGHDHDRWTKPGKPRLSPYLNAKTGQLEVREHPTLLVRSGSFLRAYEPGEASYIADVAQGPCQLGTVEIEIHVYREQRDGHDNMGVKLRGVA